MSSTLPAVSLAKLREAREQAGLTQEQVAPRVNVTRSTLQNYEHGVRVPRIDVFAGLARLYGVPMESLLDHVEEPASGGTPGTENRGAAA